MGARAARRVAAPTSVLRRSRGGLLHDLSVVARIMPEMRIVLAVWVWFALASAAHAARVDVVLGERSPIYLEAAQALRAELGAHQTEEFAAGQYVGGDAPALVITLGTSALEHVLSAGGRAPVLAVLVTRSSFERIAAAAGARRALSAIYLDQPYRRQLGLVQAVLPAAGRVGVLTGSDGEAGLARLQAAARERGVTVAHERAAGIGDIHASLTRLLPQVDVVLALPDARVINATTLPNILLASYRAKRPVIGFSPDHVRVGALAAVHSTPAQLGRQAGEVAARVAAGAPLPAAQPPRDFSVSVNRTVARAFDLRVDDEKTLAARLAGTERGP